MKNKEIEELLNELKEYASGGMSGLYPSEDTVKKFVSYIEQLEEAYDKEKYLVDKLTRQLKDEYENTEYQKNKAEQLENNRDKAIEYLEIELSQGGERELRDLVDGYEVLKLLKGDSDYE